MFWTIVGAILFVIFIPYILLAIGGVIGGTAWGLGSIIKSDYDTVHPSLQKIYVPLIFIIIFLAFVLN